jgi:hypothetical protein
MEQNEAERLREVMEEDYIEALMGLGLTEYEAERDVEEYLEGIIN